jgi:predicted nucleic acid-binding protein
VRELCRRYEDLPLGLADAAVIAIAERLGERSIATLDHRHFSVVRPRHVRSLSLLPT